MGSTIHERHSEIQIEQRDGHCESSGKTNNIFAKLLIVFSATCAEAWRTAERCGGAAYPTANCAEAQRIAKGIAKVNNQMSGKMHKFVIY